MTEPSMPTGADEPISNLDESLDELITALAQTPDLEGLIVGLDLYALMLPSISIDHPMAVDALSVAPIWAALSKTAGEVLALRRDKTNGYT